MSNSITIQINGEAFYAEPGASLASVIQTYSSTFRRSPKYAEPRGLYCGMGVCFECMVVVDGKPMRACITPVSEGMTVEIEQ